LVPGRFSNRNAVFHKRYRFLKREGRYFGIGHIQLIPGVIHAPVTGLSKSVFPFLLRDPDNVREAGVFKPFIWGRLFHTGKAFQISQQGMGDTYLDTFSGGVVQAVRFGEPGPFLRCIILTVGRGFLAGTFFTVRIGEGKTRGFRFCKGVVLIPGSKKSLSSSRRSRKSRRNMRRSTVIDQVPRITHTAETVIGIFSPFPAWGWNRREADRERLKAAMDGKDTNS
jgi:hypothetical protein